MKNKYVQMKSSPVKYFLMYIASVFFTTMYHLSGVLAATRQWRINDPLQRRGIFSYFSIIDNSREHIDNIKRHVSYCIFTTNIRRI